MAGVPINFALPAEAAIQTYDWYDLSSGFGYKKFYAMNSTNASTRVYGIVTEQFYSNDIVIDATSEKTFSATLNTGITIEGTAFLTFPFTIATNGSGQNGTITAKLYVNTTQLGATFTESYNMSSDPGGTEGFLKVASFTIPFTVLKEGDTFSIKVTASGWTTTRVGCDPANRSMGATDAGSSNVSEMVCLLPIKIER